MMPKPLLLLAALTLCCCIATLQAYPSRRCLCIKTISTPINERVIKKIEVIPISGACRRTEIIITRRNNHKVCVNPQDQWVNELLSRLQNNNETNGSPTKSPAASTDNF